MDKVMKFFKNKWFILFISILNGAYTACLCCFAVGCIFYEIEYINTVKFAILYSVFSVIITMFMFYTRESFVTSLFNILNMFAFFPCLLLEWGNWALIVPAAVVTLFGFFSSKMSDTLRTVFGTIFLLMYIIGGVAFFLIANVFTVSTVDTLIEQGVSPSGYFRYYVLNIENKSSGKTAVYIEPNTLDKEISDILVLNTTIKKMVKQANNPTEMVCRWDGDKLYINDEEYFCEDDYIEEVVNGKPEYNFLDDNWKHTCFEQDYPIYTALSRNTALIIDKLKEFFTKDENELPEQTLIAE